MNIFEYAVKNKVRFSFRGTLNTEDLWDLDVEALDTIYRGLKAEEKKIDEDSLLTKNKTDKRLEVKIEIVKHIVEYKLALIERNKQARAKRAKKQEILAIINQKENEAMGTKSIEELTAMLEELDD